MRINGNAIKWIYAKREDFLNELSTLKILVKTIFYKAGEKSEIEQILAQFLFECFFEKLFIIYEEEKKSKQGQGLVVL